MEIDLYLIFFIFTTGALSNVIEDPWKCDVAEVDREEGDKEANGVDDTIGGYTVRRTVCCITDSK